jgi:nicotinate-nucleotide adenylyltransferase
VARIGLLGGTFNPPHVGHLICAQEARARLRLERVLLVPVHTPPHKEAEADPGVEARVALCEAAAAGDARLAVSRAEADVPGPSFTVDTLRRLHDQCPEDQLTFIVGADMARSLPRWRAPAQILSLAELGVAGREGVSREEIESALSELPGARERVRFFDMPRVDISSTMIRSRVAQGLPIRHLVPDAVASLIASEGLYAGVARA